MTTATYVPAIGVQMLDGWKRNMLYEGNDGKMYDMKFFTDKSFFRYPIALQSIFFSYNKYGKDINFREAIEYPKDYTLITDSAGFSIATMRLKGEVCPITPMISLREQEKIGDIGMNLDIPTSIGCKPTYESFTKALKESTDNFKMFEEQRKNFDMKLYNVIHGEDIKALQLWYDSVKEFKFDGWAAGIVPRSDPMLQALGFMFLYEKGELTKESCKGYHFFGVSGKHVVPAIVYAASKVKIPSVTYDSSSYNVGSIYREYYMPFEFGPHMSFGDKFFKDNPNIKELPCMCPVCSKVKDIQELNKGDLFAGVIICLHNMYQYILYNKTLNSLVQDRKLFVEYLKSINIAEKTLMSLDFIDYCLENGLDNAVKKFEPWLKGEELKVTKQKDIWSF